MNGKDVMKLLREWYKPTKQGEEARRLLSNEAGLVGKKKKAQH